VPGWSAPVARAVTGVKKEMQIKNEKMWKIKNKINKKKKKTIKNKKHINIKIHI